MVEFIGTFFLVFRFVSPEDVQRHEDQRFGAERVIANLRIIAILSSLKSNAAP